MGKIGNNQKQLNSKIVFSISRNDTINPKRMVITIIIAYKDSLKREVNYVL